MFIENTDPATRSDCADCGGLVQNWDFFDLDNLQNVAGTPPCRCRNRIPSQGENLRTLIPVDTTFTNVDRGEACDGRFL